MSAFDVVPIGWVESELTERADAPRQPDESAPPATLVFDSSVSDGLLDLEPGQELLVLTWLHRANRETLAVRPRSDPDRPLTGVFSTRSPDRPNPVGIHTVRIAFVDGLRIGVEALEAIDGTPVIDLKPVLTRDVVER